MRKIIVGAQVSMDGVMQARRTDRGSDQGVLDVDLRPVSLATARNAQENAGALTHRVAVETFG